MFIKINFQLYHFNYKMLKISTLVFIFSFGYSFLTLGDSKSVTKPANAKPKVLCTTTIIHDIAKNIAGDKMDLVCLMPVGGDPHIYEPTPGDAKKVADAEIIIKNGFFLEGWLDELIESAAKTNAIYVASEGIEPIKSVNSHGSPDPHAWMNPLLGIEFARNIKEAFQENDVQNATFYEANFQKYKAQLLELEQYIQSKIKLIPQKQRVLITSHDAFRYYGNQFGIRVESALGNTTDAEVQIGDINRLIDVIHETGISSIFIESTINPKLLNQLAQDHGVKIGGKLFGDSVGDENSGASTYIDMLKYDTDVIVKGLSTRNQALEIKQVQTVALIFSALFLFVWAFFWLYFKIKPLKESNENWEKYNVEVKNISVSYEKKTVLSNINFNLESGKIYGLLGPNGAGKSTLFKTILGLIKPDTGSIVINNKTVDEIRDKIAYIPQKEEIDWSFPATVFDIVLTGRLPHKSRFETYSKLDKDKAHSAIHRMGLDELKNRQIGDLSGGQQQRVFIARALCQEAEVLFFDEPFVGVDITTEEKIIAIIKKLASERKTIIMIHHDLSKVKDYFDFVIMINQRLIAFGPTNQIFTNENIAKTYSGRLAILQETDKYVFE